MLRIAKPPGFGNVVVEEAPVPEVGPRDVLVRTEVSLISRGSEILRRYMSEEAIDPAIMGYSAAGVVADVGAEATERFQRGDRVSATTPHAQYVCQDIDAMEGSRIWPLPDEVSFEGAVFLPLVTSGITWAAMPGIQPDHTVVVLGQGLVGNLVMQAAQLHLHHQLIAVDAIDDRCQLSTALGAEHAINAAETDPVAAVRELTGGRGADVVFDCVGGKAGVRSFAQAQEMVRDGGTIHLIGLYHGETLPLDAGLIQHKRLIGGYYGTPGRNVMIARAIELLQAGRIRVEPLITHRFPFTEAKAAYDLLYQQPADALGVLLEWSE